MERVLEVPERRLTLFLRRGREYSEQVLQVNCDLLRVSNIAEPQDTPTATAR